MLGINKGIKIKKERFSKVSNMAVMSLVLPLFIDDSNHVPSDGTSACLLFFFVKVQRYSLNLSLC